jgi:hypothetical protein
MELQPRRCGAASVSTTSADGATSASVGVADGPLGAAAPATAAATAVVAAVQADASVSSVSTLRSPPRPGSGTMEVVRLQRMRSMSQESLPDGVVDHAAQDSMDMSRLAIDDDPFASLDATLGQPPALCRCITHCRCWRRAPGV